MRVVKAKLRVLKAKLWVVNAKLTVVKEFEGGEGKIEGGEGIWIVVFFCTYCSPELLPSAKGMKQGVVSSLVSPVTIVFHSEKERVGRLGPDRHETTQ